MYIYSKQKTETNTYIYTHMYICKYTYNMHVHTYQSIHNKQHQTHTSRFSARSQRSWLKLAISAACRSYIYLHIYACVYINICITYVYHMHDIYTKVPSAPRATPVRVSRGCISDFGRGWNLIFYLLNRV